MVIVSRREEERRDKVKEIDSPRRTIITGKPLLIDLPNMSGVFIFGMMMGMNSSVLLVSLSQVP